MGLMGLTGRMGRLRDGESERGGFHGRRGKAFCQEEKMFFQVEKNVFLGKEEKGKDIYKKKTPVPFWERL